MVVHTNDILELANHAHNPELFLQLVNFVNEKLGTHGKLFTSQTATKMTMIGYNLVEYKNSCYDGDWPLVAIAPQQNTINIYIMIVVDGNYLVPEYSKYFGKSNVGKSCIRIRSMNDLKYQGLEQILTIVNKQLQQLSK